MKTRKVGRVLSLLLAIAMAVGLMIPALSVFAEDTGYVKVSTLAQLQKVLKTAPTDGTPVKIRLEATIHVPLAKWVFNEETFGTSHSGYLADFYGALKSDGTALTAAEAEALMQQYMKPESENSYYCGLYTINRSYTGDRAWPANLYDLKRHLRAEYYHTYDGTTLKVKTGSNVTIDLNGNSILLYETDDKGNYNGSTNSWQSRNSNNLPAPNPTTVDSEDAYGCRSGNGGWASVITVMKNATFTLQDKQGGGKLSGGTGNVVEANNIQKVLKSNTYYVDPASSNGLLHQGSKGQAVGVNGYAGVTASDYGIPDIGQSMTEKGGCFVNYKNVQLAVYDLSGKAKTIKGGGVYVDEGATFNMESGIITENTSWISDARNKIFSAGTGEHMYALGGGVYVGKNATFNMTGGTITKNNARSYTGVNVSGGAKYLAMAQGGGVYIDEGAVMNFSGGNVDDNSTAVYADTNKTGGETKSQGGGIFVNTNGTLNMIGDQTSLDFNDYPTVRDNTCGGYLYARTEISQAAYLYLEGAGIMLKGSANLSRAVIAFNTFPNIASGSVSNDSTSLTMIKRNDSTREVYYVDQWGCYGTHEGTDHAAAQASGNYTKLYKEGDTYEGYNTTTDADGNITQTPVTKTVTFATDTVKTSDTWLYGADLGRIVRSNAYGYQNGAGIYLGRDVDANNEFTASMTIGDRVWCYDNWDQVTNIEQQWSKESAQATHDDVCLGTSPDGTRLQYIGLAEPATECKIGVNVIGTADRKIIARKANDNALHQEVWEDINEGYDPTIVDCQFFYDNGANATGSSYIKNPPTRTVIYERPEDSGNYLDPHATEHVLGFGLYKDGYNKENDTYRVYVALNYNEANVHKYAKYQETSTGVMTGEWQDTFVGNDMWLSASNSKEYTVTLPRPDYAFYGVALPANPGANNSLTMTSDNSEERADLYFKGYEFYAPYGHSEGFFDFQKLARGDSTKANPLPGYSDHKFKVSDLLTWNDNKIHISVPSYNAMWYTERELKQSRNDVAVPKAMILVDSQGEVYIRVASLVGGYVKNISWPDLQPTVHTAADGTELYFDKPAFVASSINATPTLEGGYKSNNKMGSNGTYDANLTKKLVCNATNTKTTLDSWDYIQGNINDGLWSNWIANGAYSTANVSGSNKYVGIMWTNIDTGVNIKDVYTDYENMVFSDYAKQVIYVTPCIEVLKGSASGEHYTYYYGESRAFSIEQLIKADVAAGGTAPAPTTQG